MMVNKAFPADDTTRKFFAVSLALVAGVANTIGFLEYSQLFMSFMSGNTYVTGAVIRFGAGLANMLLHKPASSFWIQGPLWVGLTAGAICGGVLQHNYGEEAFLAPAALAAALAAIALVMTIMTILAPRSPLVVNEMAPLPDAAPDASSTVL